jgi:hypothetical protein
MSIAFNPILINQDTDEDFDESDALELFPTHTQVQTLYLTKTNPIVSGSIQATNFKSTASTLSNPSLHNTTHNNGIHLDATGVHLEQGGASLVIAKPSELEVNTAIRSTGSNQATNFKSTTSTLTNPSLHNTTHNNGVHLDATGVHLEQGNVSLLIAKPSELEVNTAIRSTGSNQATNFKSTTSTLTNPSLHNSTHNNGVHLDATGVHLEQGGASLLIAKPTELECKTKLIVQDGTVTAADSTVEGAIYSVGGINSGNNIRGQKFYTSVSSNAAPGFSFSSQTNLGINRTASNVISLISNGTPQLSVGATGAYFPGRLGIGLSVIPGADQLYVSGTAAANQVATTGVFISPTALVDNRVVISSASKDSYLVVDNGVNGYHIGLKSSDGSFSISSGSNKPSDTATPAVSISSTGVVSMPINLKLNNILMHNKIFTGSVNLEALNGGSFTSAISANYILTRMGREVKLTIDPVIFGMNLVTDLVAYRLDTIFSSHGLTVNSLPPQPSGFYAGSVLLPRPIINRNGSLSDLGEVRISMVADNLTNLRLTIYCFSVFSGATNSFASSGSGISWTARGDAL